MASPLSLLQGGAWDDQDWDPEDEPMAEAGGSGLGMPPGLPVATAAPAGRRSPYADQASKLIGAGLSALGDPSQQMDADRSALRAQQEAITRKPSAFDNPLLRMGLEMMVSASKPGATLLGSVGAGGKEALSFQEKQAQAEELRKLKMAQIEREVARLPYTYGKEQLELGAKLGSLKAPSPYIGTRFGVFNTDNEQYLTPPGGVPQARVPMISTRAGVFDPATGTWHQPPGGMPKPGNYFDRVGESLTAEEKAQAGFKPDDVVVWNRFGVPDVKKKAEESVVDDEPDQRRQLAENFGVPFLPMDQVPTFRGLKGKYLANARAAEAKSFDKWESDINEKDPDTKVEGQMRNLDRFLELAEVTKKKQGSLLNRAGTLGQAISAFGDPEIQEMGSISSDLARKSRQPGEGAVSDFDAAQFLKIAPGVDKEFKTNVSIVQAMKAAEQLKLEKRSFMREYFQVNGTLSGAEGQWKQYARANTIFAPRSKPGDPPTLNDARVDYKTWFKAMSTLPPGFKVVP